jgi:hypothetical protein
MQKTIEQRNPRGNQAPFYTKYWGLADQLEEVAEGIVRYWTPSHGGYELSAERMLEMCPEYRATSFTGDNAFEEDCSWCGVALAFPHLFSAKDVIAAQNTFNAFYAGKAA